MRLHSIGFSYLHESNAVARPSVGKCHSASARTRHPGSVLAVICSGPLRPPCLRSSSIGTEAQRRGPICWSCMASVSTERHQGVDCAHIRAHMPNASRIRRLRALRSFVIDSYLRFGIGMELAPLNLPGMDSAANQLGAPQKRRKPEPHFRCFWPVLPLSNCYLVEAPMGHIRHDLRG